MGSEKGDSEKFLEKVVRQKGKARLNFPNNQLLTYFSTLLNSEDNRNRDDNKHEILAPSMDTMTQNLFDQNLIRYVSLEEVTLMAKKLKGGGASGLDLASPELLKNTNEQFMLVFTKLFNKLLHSGKFPKE